MRLWHYELIPYLPKSQLLAQWRELNSIFKKHDNHILINYVYQDNIAFQWYAVLVATEMIERGFKINFENYKNYFKPSDLLAEEYFAEHDDEYLTICYWNLREKYLRGQKDFTKEIWDKLNIFYKERMEMK